MVFVLAFGTLAATVPAVAGSRRPKLYDNTSVCPGNPRTLAFGGSTFPGPPLSVLDYFETPGGTISGFDLYLLNGGADPGVGGGAQPISEFKFFEGSDSTRIGTWIPGALFRTPPQGGTFLSPIPVHVDANGVPLIIKVAVDYDAGTYNVTDAATGTPLTDDLTDDPIVDQDIGARPRITLPPGKAGVLLRLGGEWSVCATEDGVLGDPKSGPVLAGGGSGNEDGVFIINVQQCPDGLQAALCDDPGWDPLTPCTGGAECSVGRPYHGIMMTLYTSPNEDEDGNNSIAAADSIAVGSPSPCTSELATVHGFLGDNGLPIPNQTSRCFDGDPTPNGDDDVDLLDWRLLQICFGPTPPPECARYDNNTDGQIAIDDYAIFQQCMADPDEPRCNACPGENPVQFLKDVDVYEIAGLTGGQVVEVLVEGSKNLVTGPLWDPFLRIFADESLGFAELGVSDNFERRSLDAFTTVEVPGEVTTIYVGVSSAANADYDPQDASSISKLDVDQAGGYSLTVVVADPTCVQDDQGGGTHDCYVSKHEPDDTLADADARGDVSGYSSITGAIGDGAFAAVGQDIDIYRINLSGPLASVRSLVIRTANAYIGYETVFDLAMGLYDSSGRLIATGDQAATATISGQDRSRPQLAANVDGATESGDGVYYLAVFGTDRGLFNDDDEAVFPGTPPSIVNFPHGPGLQPIVGGRVNKPGSVLTGREPPSNPPPSSPTLQCYRLILLTSTSRLETTGRDDLDEMANDNGNDSIPLASSVGEVGDRLAESAVVTGHLGNGPFGGWQGDVDFFAIPVVPGQTISVNIADSEQPPLVLNDHSVRSYLALYDDGGRVLAHGFSLERENGQMIDGVSDEIAAVVVATVPEGGDGTVHAMVGIDNGNLLDRENMPFDPFQPGTTLSRRFETKTRRARQYGIAVTLLDPLQKPTDAGRMYVVPAGGVDEDHVSCFVNGPNDGTRDCWPPILEVDPDTGQTLKVIQGGDSFSTTRNAQGSENFERDEFVSANPLIAFDGRHLWIVIESCTGGQFCESVGRTLFKMDPDLLPDESGYLTLIGPVEGLDRLRARTATGMVELNGYLYLLDNQNNDQCQEVETCYSLRWWDKTVPPVSSNGGRTIDLTGLSGQGPNPTDEFDDVDGDVGTDGEKIYIGCSMSGVGVGVCLFAHDPETNVVTFEGIVDDPITNSELTPGPRLGGLDMIGGDIMVTTDRNSPIVQYWEMGADEVRGYRLPSRFVIQRLTIR